MATDPAVLGLHVGLNSSAALVTFDGRLAWAEQEERHSRQKNHCGFPSRAVRAAVDHAARTGLQVDHVAVGGRTVFPHDVDRAGLLDAYRGVFDAEVAGETTGPAAGRVDAAHRVVRDRLADLLPGRPALRFVDHHHCHAAAAYHFLRQDDAAYLVVTLDGEGDGHSSTVWVGEHGRLERVAATSRDASAGLLYFWVTYLMGLQPHEDEHKVMGLAGHVDPSLAQRLGAELFGPLLDVDDDALALVVPRGTSTPWMQRLDDRCRRVRFDHLAGAVQSFVEGLATRLVAAAVAKTGIRRVLLSGGVAMNVKLNRAVRLLDDVEVLDVMPSAGDESLSIGAAYLAATDAAGPRRFAPAVPSIYTGTDLTPDDTRAALEHARGLGCRVVADAGDAIEAAAAAVTRGELVAICAGRGEFGARALGHRSLLANPASPAAVAELNTTVKQRDFWMPFAPVMLEHRAAELLADYDGRPSRWMAHAFAARRDERIRGAVHTTDWTCRPQILTDTSDEPVAEILRLVDEQADLPALVNTSLNQHGEPIARTARDAVRLLERTPLRYLLVGDRLLEQLA